MEEKQIKVTYTFYLPEHEDEHRIFSNAQKGMNALEEISNLIRSYNKGWRDLDDKLVDEISERLADSGLYD